MDTITFQDGQGKIRAILLSSLSTNKYGVEGESGCCFSFHLSWYISQAIQQNSFSLRSEVLKILLTTFDGQAFRPSIH